VADNQMTEPIHARLGQRGLLPGEHLLDSGYPSAELLVSSQTDYGITLVTPMLPRHLTTGPSGRGIRAHRVYHRLPTPSTLAARKAAPAAHGIR